MPVGTLEKVNALSNDFNSPRRLADLLGVQPTQITRWRRGEAIHEFDAQRVDLLEFVLSNLSRLYSPDTVQTWLVSLNQFLGGRRPIDLVRSGSASELLDAIAQERAGSFA